MKVTIHGNSNGIRQGLLWVGCFVLAVFVAGCCTCKITTDPKIILIVKKPDPVAATPEGAFFGFAEELKDGDTVRFINRFGKDVKVTFPNNVIDGENPFEVKRCDEKLITINFVGTPPDDFIINLDGGSGHGSAKIIVDPG